MECYEFLETSLKYDINGFAVECKKPEKREVLVRIAKILTGLDEKNSENQNFALLENFSRKFNVQIHFHIACTDNVIRIMNNRLTDALVINIFKSNSKYSPIYVEKYYELSVENHNISTHFSTENLRITGNFIPVQAAKILITELNDHILEKSQINEIKKSNDQLIEKTGDIWPFSSEIQLLLNYPPHSEACLNCKNMKIKVRLDCSHGFCSYCAKLIAKTQKCISCSMMVSPSMINSINQLA
jgi:hypothetical protein